MSRRPLGIWWCGTAATALWLFGVRGAHAQDVSGSVRLDYQNAGSYSGAAGSQGTLSQLYYIRAMDRLFVKNLLVFMGSFPYRTGQAGQPVDFRPRYDLQLTSTGYGGRVGYEPYTLRQGDPTLDEHHQRWRSNIFVKPDRWPSLGFDMTKQSTDRSGQSLSHDDWTAYSMTWQPGPHVLSSSYSRQVRNPRDSLVETIETYRAIASTDHALPGHGRMSLSYNYDRSWHKRTSLQTGALDQHVPSASVSLQPSKWLTVGTQYSGRYVTSQISDTSGPRHANDQLATGNLTLRPAAGWSLGLSRYFEKTRESSNQVSHRTDYWQVQASTERQFFRQLRAQLTTYRIMYIGAPVGARYSDAYFVSVRGRPHQHAELTCEVSLADRHGLQLKRFAANGNSYVRLYPTHGSLLQVGYNAVAEATSLSNFDIGEESISSSLQYTPDTRLSLTGGAVIRRNRRLDSIWRTAWTGATTYRWPGFANASVYYTRRKSDNAAGVQTMPAESALDNWTASLDVLLGPSTTAALNFSRRIGGGLASHNIWGLSFSTQF